MLRAGVAVVVAADGEEHISPGGPGHELFFGVAEVAVIFARQLGFQTGQKPTQTAALQGGVGILRHPADLIDAIAEIPLRVLGQQFDFSTQDPNGGTDDGLAAVVAAAAVAV